MAPELENQENPLTPRLHSLMYLYQPSNRIGYFNHTTLTIYFISVKRRVPAAAKGVRGEERFLRRGGAPASRLAGSRSWG
jgi:hypothetical protein